MKVRETIEEHAARVQCPTCRWWFMTKRQRDAHVAKGHDA